MYHQIKPTETFRERQLVLLKEAEDRRRARRLRVARRTPKARSTVVAAAVLGFLAALLVASLMLVASSSPAHASTTFTVNNTGNQPDLTPNDDLCVADTFGTFECTLRAAIEQANATPGADQINFNLPSGVRTIQPISPLPAIEEQVAIDGYTQQASSPNTLAEGDNAVIRVELDGRSAGNTSGLKIIRASNTVVRGLAINNFSSDGIFVQGGLGVRIEGNFIGTDPSGTIDVGNGGDGVNIRESGFGAAPGGAHIIGDGTPASRNIISGNESDGVTISGGPSNNRVQGNYIGTDKDGTDNLTNDDMGNNVSGVTVFGGSNDNTIGGAAAGQGNVISSNDSKGIFISNSKGNAVLGNRIGTDRTGTKDLGNAVHGVVISNAANNDIGDISSGASNTIAFNGRDGVNINGSSASIPNANANSVLSNSIFSNGDLGIDLDPDGVNANDPGDADTGANGLQNFPVISSARTSRKATTIKGTLNSGLNSPYIVQFFSNPKGGAEGKTFRGQKTVFPDGSGNATFTFKPNKKVAAGQIITATATKNFFNIPSDTSEFSAAKKVVVRKR